MPLAMRIRGPPCSTRTRARSGTRTRARTGTGTWTTGTGTAEPEPESGSGRGPGFRGGGSRGLGRTDGDGMPVRGFLQRLREPRLRQFRRSGLAVHGHPGFFLPRFFLRGFSLRRRFRPRLPSGSSAASTPATDVTAGAAAPTCAAGSLKVTAHQAADRPAGHRDRGGRRRVHQPLGQGLPPQGPSVRRGSRQRLSRSQRTAHRHAQGIRVAGDAGPRGKAWVKLTFVQVQGEGDGYCASGADPVGYPTVVVGLPGSGRHQVALDDGQFAECDNKVTVTAVSAVRPS